MCLKSCWRTSKSKPGPETFAWAPQTVWRFKWKVCREERKASLDGLCCNRAQQGFPPRAQLVLLGGGTQPFPCSDLRVGSFLPCGAGDPSYLMEKLLWQNAKSSCSGLFLIYCRWKIRTHFWKIYVWYPFAVLDGINGSWQNTGHEI